MLNSVSTASSIIRIHDSLADLLESIASVLDARDEEEFRWQLELLRNVYANLYDAEADGVIEPQTESVVNVDPQVAEYVERATALQAEAVAADRENKASAREKRSVELHEEEVPDTIEVSDEEEVVVDDNYFASLLTKE